MCIWTLDIDHWLLDIRLAVHQSDVPRRHEYRTSVGVIYFDTGGLRGVWAFDESPHLSEKTIICENDGAWSKLRPS